MPWLLSMRRAWLETLWYHSTPLRWVLYPVSLLYQAIMQLRTACIRRVCQKTYPVPIIVVGNITVGGVGKTPLVIALAKHFTARGVRVGIVSRGYGATIRRFPHHITCDDTPLMVGDEPFLIAQKTGCPVVIAPKRTQAVEYLLAQVQPQVILSDDGLQHTKMGRALEIVVIDGSRGLGNGFCLPAGPLRESALRLSSVDMLVVNEGKWPHAHSMRLLPGSFARVATGESVSQQTLKEPIAAVAGIGHPQRFFDTLTSLGVSYSKHPFPDHHLFTANELFCIEKTIVMTEKDAVKCNAFATDAMYYLPVDAVMDQTFWDALWSQAPLQGLK